MFLPKPKHWFLLRRDVPSNQTLEHLKRLRRSSAWLDGLSRRDSVHHMFGAPKHQCFSSEPMYRLRDLKNSWFVLSTILIAKYLYHHSLPNLFDLIFQINH